MLFYLVETREQNISYKNMCFLVENLGQFFYLIVSKNFDKMATFTSGLIFHVQKCKANLISYVPVMQEYGYSLAQH